MSGQVIRHALNGAKSAREDARREQQKERGLWSFLTWSFFMSQLLADGQFLGAASAASKQTDEMLQEDAAGAREAMARGSLPDLPEGALGEEGAGSAPRGDGAMPGAQALNVDPRALSEFTPSQVADQGADLQAGMAGAAGVAALQEGAAASDAVPPGAGPVGSDGGPDGAGGNGVGCPGTGLPGGPIIGLPGIIEGVGDVGDVIDGIIPPLTGTIDTAVGTLTDTITDAVHAINGTVNELVSSLDTTLDTLVGDLNGTLQHTTASLTSALDDIGIQVDNVLDASLDQVTQTVSTVTTATSAVVSGLTDTVETTTAHLTDGVAGTVNGAVGAISGVIASPGAILFKPIAADATNALFSDGQYTD